MENLFSLITNPNRVGRRLTRGAYQAGYSENLAKYDEHEGKIESQKESFSKLGISIKDQEGDYLTSRGLDYDDIREIVENIN